MEPSGAGTPGPGARGSGAPGSEAPGSGAPGTAGRLLVVDDEPFLRDAVAASLRFLGYEVATAENGAEALRAARGRPFDLVVLDVMLPDTDGFEVVRRLRQDGCGVPVIFLTARDAEADKVTGLTLGGDDYMTKPFGLEELAARVRTVLRRTRGAGADQAPGPVLAFADLELDQETYEVRRDGHLIELSPTEYRLLRYLMLHPGRVLTRAQLLDHVWDYGGHGSTTVVATYVAYLRRKLARYGPDLIHTQRAVGYSLRLPHPGEPGSLPRGAEILTTPELLLVGVLSKSSGMIFIRAPRPQHRPHSCTAAPRTAANSLDGRTSCPRPNVRTWIESPRRWGNPAAPSTRTLVFPGLVKGRAAGVGGPPGTSVVTRGDTESAGGGLRGSAWRVRSRRRRSGCGRS